MALSDTHEPVIRDELHVGVPQRPRPGRFGSNGDGVAVGEAVEALGREVDVDHDAVVNRVRPTPVFVDAGPHIGRCRREVLGAAVAGAPDEHLASTFFGARFEPIESGAVAPGLLEAGDTRDGVGGGDRRRPGSVGQSRSHGAMVSGEPGAPVGNARLSSGVSQPDGDEGVTSPRGSITRTSW